MLTDGITTTSGATLTLPKIGLMCMHKIQQPETKKRVLTAQTLVAEEFKPNFEVYTSNTRCLNLKL